MAAILPRPQCIYMNTFIMKFALNTVKWVSLSTPLIKSLRLIPLLTYYVWEKVLSAKMCYTKGLKGAQFTLYDEF